MAELRNVAVVGFGTMGAAITQVFAQSVFMVTARTYIRGFLEALA
jgi:3-hydroxyacyl-CoA dehydrogenase